jgi:hypothetical protein
MFLYVLSLTSTIRRIVESDAIILIDGDNKRSKVIGEELSKVAENCMIVNCGIKIFESETRIRLSKLSEKFFLLL